MLEPTDTCQLHKDRTIRTTIFSPAPTLVLNSIHLLPSVGLFYPEGIWICSNIGRLLPAYTTLYRARVRMSNFSLRLPAILILMAGLTLLLSSVLCLAFKMTAYTSYMQQTSWGTSMTTVKSPGYGADGWMNLYPKHLMPVARAPLVVAGSIGPVTGLAVTWLAAWHLRTKRVLQVRNPSACREAISPANSWG